MTERDKVGPCFYLSALGLLAMATVVCYAWVASIVWLVRMV